MTARVLVGSVALGVGMSFLVVPAGGSAVALANHVTAHPAAHVSGLSPSKGKAGTKVKVKGRNFKHVKKVLFGSTPAKFTVSSAKSIKATAPPHARGTVDVRVVTVGKKSAKTKADRFTYAPPPPPPGLAVTSVSPASGNVAGGSQVTVRGTRFSELSSVYFGTVRAAPVTFHSSTELTVRAPAHPAGSVDVRVVVGSRKTSLSHADRYSYTASPYAISALPLVSDETTGNVGPISCGAPGSCVVAGTDNGAESESEVIDFFATLADGTWSRTDEPLPNDATAVDEGAYAGPISLSCPAAGSCISVSEYLLGSFATHGVIDTLANGTWTATTAPVPANANTENPAVHLDAVTCLSSTSCRAVGDYTDDTDEQDPLVETLSGTTWTASSPTQPSNLDPHLLDTAVQLLGLSCSTIESCAAFGYYADTDGNLRRWFDVLAVGSWTATEAPLPSDIDDADDSQSPLLNDISCGGAGSCVAVGSYDNNSGGISGLLETLSSGTWTARRAPLPSGANTFGTTDVNAISCPSAASCEAVGGFDASGGNRYGFIDTLSGGSWSAIRAPLPANAASGEQFGGLSSVSCPASGSCTTVGDYSDTDDDDVSAFASLSGGSWRAVEASLPSTLNAVARTLLLTSVDCPSTSSCAASGTFTNKAGDTQGLLETSD
jgi:hypothetical protein